MHNIREYVALQTSPALEGQDEQFSDEFSFAVTTETNEKPPSPVATAQVNY